MSRITKNIYLSGIGHAQSCHQNYDMILSIINPGDKLSFNKNQGNHMILEFLDNQESSLLPYLEKASLFISKAIKENKKILVHCQQGISRSSSIVIAYLILADKMTFREAFKGVLSKRETIMPNPKFISELRKLSGEESNQETLSEQELEKKECHSCGRTLNYLLDGGKCYKKCLSCHQIVLCAELKNHLRDAHQMNVP